MFILLMAAVAALPAESPPQLSVEREVVLLSGVTLSVAGSVLAGYAAWKGGESSAVAASALIGAGIVFSLGTAFGSHRHEPPPAWVFFVGPVLGVLSGMAAAFAFD